MPAYVVVDIEITDPPAFEEYRKGVPATVAKYGGRFVVRGGKSETPEGSWHPKRLALLAMRLKASKGNLVLVEGV
jgi:uncharacterized protein (DUF1330 family)